MSSNLPYIKDRHTEKPKAVLQHSGTVTRKRLRTSEFLREVGNLFAPSVSRTSASSDSD